ncbi:MAG: beta-ketoacyl-[acyl-carrier-protein] synthase family protein [Marinilabiliales bacterium]|nr:MAG: beta-ketoacyl-[acyl-carrier-protein] synthase family protein [Marinilabiliales bacterium]
MSKRVLITGMGVVSAAGMNYQELYWSMKDVYSGITYPEVLKTLHRNMPVGEIKFADIHLRDLAGIPRNDFHYTRTTLLALLAIQQMEKRIAEYDPERIGLISATTVGGMSISEQYYQKILNTGNHSNLIQTFDSGDGTDRIAKYFGIKNNVTTINTACSSSANAIMLGARLIKSGKADMVIAGGADALSKFTLNGFNALEILDNEICKPFDAERNGLNLGEAAAYVIMEPAENARPINMLCELKGYANVNDAFHPTASSPEGTGAKLAMTKALKMAGLRPKDIDYINAHGTGTEINDESEGRAIHEVFGRKTPKVSSTKAFTGHTLGAAGAVEAIISILAIQNQFVPLSLNFENKLKRLKFQPQEDNEFCPVTNVLSNSLGFGGNSTSLIFSRA